MNKKEIREKEMAFTKECPKSKRGNGSHSWMPNGLVVINKKVYQLHRCTQCSLEGMEEYIPGEDPHGSCG